MQKRTDLSYFPPNPYRSARAPLPLTQADRELQRRTWTTRPRWRIHLCNWFKRNWPAPPPAAPQTPPPPPQQLSLF